MDEIKRILAPTDLSAFSAKGLVYAANLAKALAAQVIVCHVVRTEMDAKRGQADFHLDWRDRKKSKSVPPKVQRACEIVELRSQ